MNVTSPGSFCLFISFKICVPILSDSTMWWNNLWSNDINQKKIYKNKWKQSSFEIIIHLHIPIITLRHSMPTYTVFRIKIIQTRKTETKTKSKPNIILRYIFNTQKGIWNNLLVASCDLYSCVNGPLTFEVLNQKTIILCGNLPKMAATFPKSV